VNLSLIDGIAQFARLSWGLSPLSRVRVEDSSVVFVRRFGSIVEISITPCSSIYPEQSEALKVLELEFPEPPYKISLWRNVATCELVIIKI